VVEISPGRKETALNLKGKKMGNILCAVMLLLVLSGCTAADAIKARELTLEDGARFIEENHADRREIRQKQRTLRDEVFEMFRSRANTAIVKGDFDEALILYSAANDLLRNHYPAIATVELLREGLENWQELRDLFREISRDETPVAPEVIDALEPLLSE